MEAVNRNFKYLTVLNICTIVIPLVTYPIMTERVGLEAFGYIIYIQTIVSYFSVMNSLGFNVSVTKLIAESESIIKLRTIFWNVIYIRVFLWLILLVPYAIICQFLGLNKNIYLLLYLVPLSEAIFPIWYYQGIQEMKAITIVNVIYRIVSLILIVFFVSDDNGSLKYAAIIGFTPLFLNIINVIYLTSKNKITLVSVDIKLSLNLISNSWPIFLGTIMSVLKDRTNLILIGVFVGKSEVVVYDFVTKIISVLSVVFSNLTNAQFPEISKNRSSTLFKKYLYIIVYLSLSVYLFGCLVSYLYSTNIMLFALSSTEYSNTFVYLSLMLMLLIPLRSISYQLGLGVLVSNGFDKDYSKNLFLSAILYIVFCCLLYVFGSLNLYTICISLILTVFLELLHRIWLCKRRGLIHWLI